MKNKGSGVIGILFCSLAVGIWSKTIDEGSSFGFWPDLLDILVKCVEWSVLLFLIYSVGEVISQTIDERPKKNVYKILACLAWAVAVYCFFFVFLR